jgi:hypothetical protein
MAKRLRAKQQASQLKAAQAQATTLSGVNNTAAITKK